MADAHITLVIDRSGSMTTTLADAQGGLDSFIAGLPTAEDVTISLVEFDSEINLAVAPVLASAWPGYTITPRGSTALLDAIGYAVKQTRKHLKTNPAEKVVLVVITDGGENASTKFPKEKVTDLIDKAKADGWEIVFLASDLSAVQTGADVGFAPRRFAAATTSVTYEALARGTSSYLTGASAFVDMDLDAEVTPAP